jgi:DNA mismatch repair protein MutL
MTNKLRISVLDEQTINQIAAGEVVENSSSVVKELVENTIDAGASEVCVETLGGGRGLIRVSDDGCGMSGDELLLSLQRHATSKILKSDDLETYFQAFLV